MLLKEIPGLAPSLEGTAIANSAYWNRDVAAIIPHQIVALRWLHKDDPDDIDLYLDFMMNHLHLAAKAELIPADLAILKYKRPRQVGILSSELVEGLSKMTPGMARATIFGLEMDLPLERIMTLSFKHANSMSLTQMASRVLGSQVRSINDNRAFSDDGIPFGLANEVYANFNMTWNNLRLSYKSIIHDHFEGVVEN